MTKTNKEKSNYLKQYRLLMKEYKINYATYQKLHHQLRYPGAGAQVLHITPVGEGRSNPIEADYFRLMNLEDALNLTLDKMTAIEKVILALDDTMQRTVMRLRYIDGLKWEEVCVAINYSWGPTHIIHSEALKKICVEVE